jgi:hypothetical protein
MEALVDEGVAHNIGVSNFQGSLLVDLLRYARIKPQALQIEVHPYLTQDALIKFAQASTAGVMVDVYSRTARRRTTSPSRRTRASAPRATSSSPWTAVRRPCSSTARWRRSRPRTESVCSRPQPRARCGTLTARPQRPRRSYSAGACAAAASGTTWRANRLRAAGPRSATSRSSRRATTTTGSSPYVCSRAHSGCLADALRRRTSSARRSTSATRTSRRSPR